MQMRYLFILLCVLTQTLFSQDTLLIWIDQEGIYTGKPSLFDEFNGSNLDESTWFGYYPWGGLSLDANTYTDPLLCKQASGVLNLAVDTVNEWRSFPDWMIDQSKISNDPSLMQNGKVQINRLTSAVWSKKQFRYGYFEARCFLPKGKGYWPAFWLYGGNPNEEIDIMEAKGERSNSYHVDVHCPNRCDRIKQVGFIDKPFGHWVKTKQKITGEWVTFSGLWAPEGVWFYFNDRLVAQHKVTFNTSMNLIANFSLAMDKGPFSPGPNGKTGFPAAYRIDYIRAWEIPELTNNPRACNWLKEAFFVKMVPSGAHEVKFEFSSRISSECAVFIEKEALESNEELDFIPVIKLDLNAKFQYIDYSYWSPGRYYLRIVNGTRTKQVPFLTLP